jgi:hypothetical protein
VYSFNADRTPLIESIRTRKTKLAALQCFQRAVYDTWTVQGTINSPILFDSDRTIVFIFSFGSSMTILMSRMTVRGFIRHCNTYGFLRHGLLDIG